MKKPVIGITLDFIKDSTKYNYSLFPWYALRQNYANSVIAAGGVPIMLPYSENYDELLDIIDGLLIPGGDEDINPSYYGQEIKSATVKTNEDRAKFEISLVSKALERNMPILGICNGLQLINILFNGSLIQHLPDSIESSINHEQPVPKDKPTHDIIITEGSNLYKFNNYSSHARVNSTHHQAIDKVGVGLKVTARAPDGVIEAIESLDYQFLVAVEWHPEYYDSELDRNLFKSLIDASGARGRKEMTEQK